MASQGMKRVSSIVDIEEKNVVFQFLHVPGKALILNPSLSPCLSLLSWKTCGVEEGGAEGE